MDFVTKRLNVVICLTALLLAGCSSDLDLKVFEEKDADSIYKVATDYMNKNEYSDAISVYEELERLHPYSKHIALAQLNRGKCYYKMKKYEEAASEYEIFVKTHPTHDMVPYALYMLGSIYFDQMPIIERDQEATIKALEYLQTLCHKFPESKYIEKSNVMIKSMKQQLAGREVYIARYYQSRKNFAAAISRLNTVIDSYKGTDHIPEALHRLAECYVAMGFIDEAKKVDEILQKNFKNTSWAKFAHDLLKQNG